LLLGVLLLVLLLGVRVAGGGRHQEPPEVVWLLPELEPRPEPELKPLELELPEFELPVLEFPLLELPVFELEPDEPVLEDVPLLEEVPELVDEPLDVEDVAVLCVDPGRARVTTPAAATLARVTAVVVERTLARPRSRAAMARRTLSRSALLMSPILRSRIRSLLQETSPLAMRARAPGSAVWEEATQRT
jgi:hypothetical protein